MTSFIQLDDDCLEQVFKYLSPIDLINVVEAHASFKTAAYFASTLLLRNKKVNIYTHGINFNGILIQKKMFSTFMEVFRYKIKEMFVCCPAPFGESLYTIFPKLTNLTMTCGTRSKIVNSVPFFAPKLRELTLHFNEYSDTLIDFVVQHTLLEKLVLMPDLSERHGFGVEQLIQIMFHLNLIEFEFDAENLCMEDICWLLNTQKCLKKVIIWSCLIRNDFEKLVQINGHKWKIDFSHSGLQQIFTLKEQHW